MILFGHPAFLFFLDNVLKVAALAIAAAFFLILGILTGSLLYAIFRKKWPLYVGLPVVNCAAYVWLLPKIVRLANIQMTISDQFRQPQIGYTIPAFLCLILLGLISARIVLFFASVSRRFSVSDAKSPQREGRSWQEYLQYPRTHSFRTAFREGFFAPRFGLSYLLDHPRLWQYAIIPLVLNAIVSVVAFVLFVVAVIATITYLNPLFPAGWAWLLLEIVCGIVLIAAAIAATLVMWMLLQGIFCGIYYGKLARQVELQLGTPSESLKELPFRRQVSDTLSDLASLIGFNLGFLFLHIIPLLGSICSVAGGLYYDSYFIGCEYLDYPLALRGLLRREKLAFVRKFRNQTLGLGTVIFFTNLIPLVGFVAPIAAVAGSVLLHKRLADENGPSGGSGPPCND